ncbi:Nif3-like dinuclear metal center hexameric protein [Paenibacillus lactis]|uniref:Nif3-like dinuclear metal center hexameric protein n=1 Tax=Paenibacillus lactis TaxID=228574 RepID=UPI003D751258
MTITVQDVIDRLTGQSGSPDASVDGIVAGDGGAAVRGIAVAFIASHDVIVRAAEMGANLLITHEGVFYSHHEAGPDHLGDSPVVQAKLERIRSEGMNIYRLHDAPHRTEPDVITEGLVKALGWNDLLEKHLPTAAIVVLPEGMTVQEIAKYIKDRLHLPYVRFVGSRDTVCKRIGIAVGYRGGGQHAIPLYERERMDMLIAGEGPEWETPEYVADAAAQGRDQALMLLGHGASEEPGMRLVADRLRDYFQELPVHFLPARPLIHII